MPGIWKILIISDIRSESLIKHESGPNMVTREVCWVGRCIFVALFSGSFSNLVTRFLLRSSFLFKLEVMRFKPWTHGPGRGSRGWCSRPLSYLDPLNNTFVCLLLIDCIWAFPHSLTVYNHDMAISNNKSSFKLNMHYIMVFQHHVCLDY